MDGRHHWDRLFVGIDAGKNACCLDDAGQALIEQIRRQVLEMQVDMVLFRADTAPLADAAIVEGTAPTDLTVTGLARALPYSWGEQERSIGLSL